MVLFEKPPTIQDVARAAGVSTATVSRALSSPERVSDRARDRIRSAIEATGYTINEAARSLRRQKARAIVVALPGVGNPYYSTIVDAVVGEAGSRGYGVLVANRQKTDATGWLHDYFRSSRADGLLVFDATLETGQLQGLTRGRDRLPVMVVCDERLEPHYNLVTSDNFEAATRVVQHLVALGHRRIGFVSGPTIRHYPNERLRGFQAAIERNGLEARPEWLIAGDHSARSGFRAGSIYLELDQRPTAMVCGNDEMAIGFMSRIQQGGLVCPRDVSITGFDDIEIAPYLSPPLTTMRQKRAQLGRVSTAALIDAIEGGEDNGVHITLRCELVVRASTAPPRAE